MPIEHSPTNNQSKSKQHSPQPEPAKPVSFEQQPRPQKLSLSTSYSRLTPHEILYLQRTIGNRAVSKLVNASAHLQLMPDPNDTRPGKIATVVQTGNFEQALQDLVQLYGLGAGANFEIHAIDDYAKVVPPEDVPNGIPNGVTVHGLAVDNQKAAIYINEKWIGEWGKQGGDIGTLISTVNHELEHVRQRNDPVFWGQFAKSVHVFEFEAYFQELVSTVVAILTKGGAQLPDQKQSMNAVASLEKHYKNMSAQEQVTFKNQMHDADTLYNTINYGHGYGKHGTIYKKLEDIPQTYRAELANPTKASAPQVRTIGPLANLTSPTIAPIPKLAPPPRSAPTVTPAPAAGTQMLNIDDVDWGDFEGARPSTKDPSKN